MSEKNFKTRIIHKHDTEENWNKATNFIPKQGEIIVYDIDSSHSYERIKVGDGTTNVISLPYVSETVVDAELSATSENPVQNKVIYNALGEKLDVILISFTSTTTEERRTELLTKIRSNFTAGTSRLEIFYLRSSVKYALHYDAVEGSPEYDLTANFGGIVSVLHNGTDNSMILQGIYSNYPYMIVDGSNNVTYIGPNPVPTIDYDLQTQTYRPVALDTMKLYVADAPNATCSKLINDYTFDFSKGQMLTANIDTSANITLVFGVTGNNNAKYVGRTISACITNTSTSAASTITFDSPTAIARLVGVEGGSADSLSVPALKTVKLNATLLKRASGFVVYIEYKQIN